MAKRVDIEGLEKLLKSWERYCGCDYSCSCDNLDSHDAAKSVRLFIVDEGITMITAAEAKRRVEEKIEGEAASWLKLAEESIEKAIMLKKTCMYMPYQTDFFQFVKKELEKYGYKVEYQPGYQGDASQVKVSWE